MGRQNAEDPKPNIQIPNVLFGAWILVLGISAFELCSKCSGVAVKWVNRLFNKNTALCQVVKTTYRV